MSAFDKEGAEARSVGKVASNSRRKNILQKLLF